MLHRRLRSQQTYSIDESFMNLGEFRDREVGPLPSDATPCASSVPVLRTPPRSSGLNTARRAGRPGGMNCQRFGRDQRDKKTACLSK